MLGINKMKILDSSIFDLSPIPFWLEDFSAVKNQFDLWKSDGVTDLETFLKEDTSRVLHCANLIKITLYTTKIDNSLK